ncbi:MAG TPA: hypothetical protein VGM19_05450 [Armatimonadota bacterium]|jgi:hypothetical protein
MSVATFLLVLACATGALGLVGVMLCMRASQVEQQVEETPPTPRETPAAPTDLRRSA